MDFIGGGQINCESDCCTIIKNSIISEGGWAFKISDPPKIAVSNFQRNCFDLFGVYRNKPIYIEAKFMNKLQSFNLNRIEDHQIKALVSIQDMLKDALCWIALGIKVARGDNRIYFFKNINEIDERRNNKENYKKKELELLPYYSVHKDLICLD